MVSAEDFKSDKCSKKEAISFLQDNASVQVCDLSMAVWILELIIIIESIFSQFLKDKKLFGKLQAIAKGSSKDKVLSALEAFEADPEAKKSGDDNLEEALVATKALKIKEEEAKKNQKEAAKVNNLVILKLECVLKLVVRE